jgi:predicted acetyltransferase
MQKLNLSKIQQCDQYWDFMEPQGCGRLCEKCDKIIVDFRQMKDEEVTAVHMLADEAVCGIYRKDQLVAPSKRSVKKSSKWKAWYLACLGVLFAKAGNAQDLPKQEKVEQNDLLVQRDTIPVSVEEAHGKQAVNDSLWIKGKVVDGENGEPLIGLSVVIQETKRGTVTDFDGNYLLNVTEDIVGKDSVELQFSYTGYKQISQIIATTQFAEKDTLLVDLQMNVDWMNVISFGVVRAPWHVRAWNNVKYFFRFEWLKKD